jgi:hypothetical protein
MFLRPKPADRILKNLSSAKTGKLDYKVISQTSSKNLCISGQYWKRLYLKTDSS